MAGASAYGGLLAGERHSCKLSQALLCTKRREARLLATADSASQQLLSFGLATQKAEQGRVTAAFSRIIVPTQSHLLSDWFVQIGRRAPEAAHWGTTAANPRRSEAKSGLSYQEADSDLAKSCFGEGPRLLGERTTAHNNQSRGGTDRSARTGPAGGSLLCNRPRLARAGIRPGCIRRVLRRAKWRVHMESM